MLSDVSNKCINIYISYYDFVLSLKDKDIEIYIRRLKAKFFIKCNYILISKLS